MTVDRHQFSLRLRAAQRAAGLRNCQIADAVGLSESGYSNLLAANLPGVDNLHRLCEVLNVRADWLLGLTNGTVPKPLRHKPAQQTLGTVPKPKREGPATKPIDEVERAHFAAERPFAQVEANSKAMKLADVPITPFGFPPLPPEVNWPLQQEQADRMRNAARAMPLEARGARDDDDGC